MRWGVGNSYSQAQVTHSTEEKNKQNLTDALCLHSLILEINNSLSALNDCSIKLSQKPCKIRLLIGYEF